MNMHQASEIPDPGSAKIRPVLYAQSTYYDLGKEVGKAFSVGKKYKKK